MNFPTEIPHLPPQNLDAEQSVLGAILLDNAALAEARNLVATGDFYWTSHQKIFQAMLDLSEHGEIIDQITLTEHLKTKSELVAVGGAAALAELLQAVPSAANIHSHCTVVHDNALRRRLISEAETIVKSAYNGQGLPELAAGVARLQELSCTRHSFHASKTDTPHESHFAPLTARDFLDQGATDQAVSWVLDEYLPAGGLALLASKPKEGKTTLTYELAVAQAKGIPFLGRQTSGGGVLILALEEHPRDVRIRLRTLGAELLHNLYVWCGRLHPIPETYERLTRFLIAQKVTFVLMDTLGVFWNVADENDAAEVTKAVKPLLDLARKNGACVLLVHHARKSEGAHGDEIRGSGALFAAVDVALILKRSEVQTQRVLHAVSRYPETPTELVIELTDEGYKALGDPSVVNKAARRDRVQGALSETWETPDILAKRAGVPLRACYAILAALVQVGKARRDGTGKKGSPYRYAINSIHAGDGDSHERKADQADSIHAGSLSYKQEMNFEVGLSVADQRKALDLDHD